MATATIQTSFAGGELSPSLYARVDLAKFEVGAALMRNFYSDYRGGAVNRTGTKFIADVGFAEDAPRRLMPFVVSTDASYVLVFEEEIATIYRTGTEVDSVVTPYAAEDLSLLKYAQSADVLTLAHPAYAPANLNRTSDTTFTFTTIEIGPTIQPPVITDMRAPHDGPYNYGYLVTSVDLDGTEESLPSNIGAKHTEGLDELNNRVVGFEWTAPATPASRYNVFKWGPIDVLTMVPATAWGFIGTAQTVNFTDNNIAPDYAKQPPSWGDPFSGGQIESITVTGGGATYDGSGDWPEIPYVPLEFTGDGTGAAGYAVIDKANAVIVGAFITNPGKNYTTISATADGEGGTGATFSITLSDIAPLYPSCVSYLQQRRVFAGSDLKPATFVMSQPGLFDNFNTTPVALATDAIAATISSLQVNTIKSLVPVSYGLLAFTSGGCFLIGSTEGPTGPIGPETISVTQQASPGANDLIPQLVNYDVLFGQNSGNRILRAGFAWERQSFTTSDITQLAPHLFDGYSIVDWAFASEPNKLLWVVRNDGILLSCTYVPEQEVYAWSRHDTQGLFKSICVVPEGGEDAVYVLVDRHIPNDTDVACWKTYLERLQPRSNCCIFDAWYLDSALTLPQVEGEVTMYVTESAEEGFVDLWAYDPCSSPLDPPTFNMTGFLMEAKENYSPEYVAILEAQPATYLSLWNDQQDIGQSYDHVRREIIYTMSVVHEPSTVTNDTGFTLWAGDATITIDPDEAYDETDARNKWVTRKNIDTGTVGSFNCWSAAELVPAGIGGGDGSWRRFVSSTAEVGNGPTVIDPWTGNLWQHVVGSGMFVCTVYLFRREDDYAQVISPLSISGADIGSHYEPIGVTEDWTYCYTSLVNFINPGTESFLVLTPREITADEITADQLLSYAEFALPAPFLTQAGNYRTCFNHASQMFLFGVNKVGARDYVLLQFDEPTSAPFGGPVVGGGFTDISPWAAATGPNTDITDYDLNSGTLTNNKLALYYLPTPNVLVCLTKLIPADTGVGVTDPLLFRMDCTYVDLDGVTFDYHQAFVRGYMTAAWVPTLVAADAAWAVQQVQEINLYLNQASYLFADIDYTKRWFFFQVQPVVGGVWTPNSALNRRILVEYTFAYGAAPVASRVIDEQGWDDVYTAYATAIGNNLVVNSSLDVTPGGVPGSAALFENGIYDTTEDAFWWNTESNFYSLNSEFTAREDAPFTNAPPLMKLSFTNPAEVGDVVTLEEGGLCGKITVTEIVNPSHWVGQITGDLDALRIPDDPDGGYFPVNGWQLVTPVSTFTGLGHLEGKQVRALADGTVLGPFTVSGGSVALGGTYSSVVVGLKYTQQLKTLYLTNEGMQAGTEQSKRKVLQGVSLRVDCTRGLKVGVDFAHLDTVPDLETSALYTGDAFTPVNPDWNTRGEVCIQQDHPLPAAVLGVIIGVVPGDTGR